MRKLLSLIILVFLLAVLNAPAQDRIKIKARGWVNDYAGILNRNEKSIISAVAAELERATSAELAVVTIESLGATTIENYAVNLFEKWGIGKKNRDNGLLLLVALQEREVRIEVGYGLEGVITDGTSGQIIREKIVPAFRKGDFGGGLLAASATMANLVAKDAGVELGELRALPEEAYRMDTRTAFMQLLGRIMYFVFILMIFGGRFFIFPLLFPFGGGRYWSRGGGGFGGGGSFGGFGGGLSGGGGASGRW